MAPGGTCPYAPGNTMNAVNFKEEELGIYPGDTPQQLQKH